eukprot:SAG11_NODE_11933_length_731_cov_0.533228_1_plen_160_part_01
MALLTRISTMHNTRAEPSTVISMAATMIAMPKRMTMMFAVVLALFSGVSSVPITMVDQATETVSMQAVALVQSGFAETYDMAALGNALAHSVVGSTVAVQIAPLSSRRLQGSSAVNLQVSYTVGCGGQWQSCDEVNSQLSALVTDPDTAADHAVAVIDAI